jgi:D-serine deaminase-like pyridoxal phosphate-dependent protein
VNELLAFEVFHHQTRRRSAETASTSLSRASPAHRLEVAGNLVVSYFAPFDSSFQTKRLHRDQVDDALELVFEADRNLHRDGVRAETVDDRLERAVERGARRGRAC